MSSTAFTAATINRAGQKEPVYERTGITTAPDAQGMKGVTMDGMTFVEFGDGYTENLGNFESASYELSLSLSCKDDEQSVEAAYAWAKRWVKSNLHADQILTAASTISDLPDGLLEGPHFAEIEYTEKATLNMGNYESKRVMVSLRRPCERLKAALDKTLASMIVWVRQKAVEAAEEARSDR